MTKNLEIPTPPSPETIRDFGQWLEKNGVFCSGYTKGQKGGAYKTYFLHNKDSEREIVVRHYDQQYGSAHKGTLDVSVTNKEGMKSTYTFDVESGNLQGSANLADTGAHKDKLDAQAFDEIVATFQMAQNSAADSFSAYLRPENSDLRAKIGDNANEYMRGKPYIMKRGQTKKIIFGEGTEIELTWPTLEEDGQYQREAKQYGSSEVSSIKWKYKGEEYEETISLKHISDAGILAHNLPPYLHLNFSYEYNNKELSVTPTVDLKKFQVKE